MKSDKKKSSRLDRKDVRLPLATKKEVEAREKAEEFWSDPCWAEPLDQYTSG